MSPDLAAGIALAAAVLGCVGLARSRAHIPTRRPICGDCKTPGCTGAMHEVGVHDPVEQS